jgi:hypothetical protein
MSTCCDKNPLQRSGTNQLQRQLPGLQPGYVLVDEREYADWIFFADEFSRYLKFYEVTGSVSNNWKPFFSTDISAILGTIAVQNVEVYRRSIKERFDFIRDDDNSAALTIVKQKLNELFSAIFSLSLALDGFLKKLPDKDVDGEKEFVFKANLVNQVKTRLAPAFKRLLSYYKAVDGKDNNGVPDASTNFLAPSDMSGWKVLNMQVESADVVLSGTGLSKTWWLTPAASWNAYVLSVNADESVFGPSPDPYRRINHAAHHNLFSSIFDLYLQAYSKIVQDAENALVSTLENWDAHSAHYTLFLSFLRLFRFAQSDINTITQRHLDFYYKEVLHLRPRDAEPNHAHVVLELAKQTQEHALKQGTEFKAGKDSEAREVLYELDRETTFNKAKVVSLRSVYKGDATGKDDHLFDGGTVNNINRLFSSLVANSDDGNGAALKSSHKEWHPFVNKKYEEGELSDIDMPNAQIGFAIASHYLYLAEGERRVYIKIATGNDPYNILIGTTVDCYLTTEKGWYPVLAVPFTASAIVDSGSVDCSQLSFIIPGDAPAITNYNAEVHGGTYDVTVPIIKIYLRNEDGATLYRYDDFRKLSVFKTEVKVEVGMETSGYNQKGLKQLVLSNDFGPLDGSKAFQPFGGQPAKDTSFVIGNKEIFSKKSAKVQFHLQWANLPTDETKIDYDPHDVNEDWYPYTRLKYLGAGIWHDLNSDLNIFNDNLTDITFPSLPVTLPDQSIVSYADVYDAYQINDNAGFIKLSLKGDFGHKTFLEALPTYFFEVSNELTLTYSSQPFEPYTPAVQSLYVSYSASTISTLNSNNEIHYKDRQSQFFHIYPFGETEQHPYLSNSMTFLFPQFKHSDAQGYRKDHVGEFYIGLEKLQALQSVNILFQVLEGSSDPLVAKPEEHIHWSFLSNNQWGDFKKEEINDSTRQLVQSGIISFIIPEQATTNNKILPSGYLWLRAAVTEAPGAVCKLISVDAQAAVVTFAPHDNAADFLEKALPAETISKLKLPDTSVKKIVQGYSSFGGRIKESDHSFYIRGSERLRHKARAITIWDYEHLVLEAFPSIHKVKCLNHTKFDLNADTGNMQYNEVLPGHVTVITIPDLQNRNDANPLRPYTNQNTLLEIEEYLKQRISCHVKLKVKNPRFEEVWVTFKLKLMKGFTGFSYYSGLLKQEITQFLTPWAYNSSADIQFGGKIHKSVLIDFIEERPYVDYITDVKLYHDSNPDNEDAGSCDENPDSSTISGDLEAVEASTARSILVSTPASRHVIDNIEDEEIVEVSECAGPPQLTNETDIT